MADPSLAGGRGGESLSAGAARLIRPRAMRIIAASPGAAAAARRAIMQERLNVLEFLVAATPRGRL